MATIALPGGPGVPSPFRWLNVAVTETAPSIVAPASPPTLWTELGAIHLNVPVPPATKRVYLIVGIAFWNAPRIAGSPARLDAHAVFALSIPPGLSNRPE